MKPSLRICRCLAPLLATMLLSPLRLAHAAIAHATTTPACVLQLSLHRGLQFLPPPSANIPAPTVTVSSTPQRINLTFRKFTFSVQSTSTPHGRFTSFLAPNVGHTEQIGAPMLPVWRTLVTVPNDATFTCSFSAHTSDRDALSLQPPDEPLPLQPPVPKLPGALEAAPFVRDPAAYASSNFFPSQPVRIVEIGKIASQRIVLLECAPLQYAPALRRYRIHSGLSASITFSRPLSLPPTLTPAQAILLRSLTCNSPALPANIKVKSPPRLLVIAHPLFATNLASFLSHKQSLGWVVDLTNSSIGSTPHAITNFIASRYKLPATRPDAVLLIGDVAHIPRFLSTLTDYPDTDLYFGCVDGSNDWLPDLPVGRLSVMNNSQLNALIQKIITYETTPPAPWMSKAAFMAGNDNYNITEATHNYVIATFLNPRAIASDKLYTRTYAATSADVSAAFNQGRLLGIYSGHGDVDHWADGPPFYPSDVAALTNAGTYPFVCSFACLTGKYSADECFAETWLRAPSRGAINVWASSTYSYWDEDDILEKSLFQAWYAEGSRLLGLSTLRAKYLYLTYYGATATTRRYFEMYNLFGDPSIYLASHIFAIDAPPVLPSAFLREPYNFTLNALGGCRPYQAWKLTQGVLPPGLHLDSTNGLITGTPLLVTSVVFTVQLTDALGSNAHVTSRLDVTTRLQLTTPTNLPVATLDSYYALPLRASGGIPPYTWNVYHDNYRETLAPSNWLGSGTPQNWRGDDLAWPFTLPFPFPFYGLLYTSLWVSSNGIIDFNTADTDFSNSDQELRDHIRIAPLWDDLITNTPSDDIFIITNASLVAIRWKYATYFPRTPVNAELVLYPNGCLHFNYGPAHTSLSPTIGISGGPNTQPLFSYLHNTSTIPPWAGSFIAPRIPPPGLQLSSQGLLHGTPAITGNFAFTLTVADSASPPQKLSHTFVLDVVPEPAHVALLAYALAFAPRRSRARSA
ncbi:MAG: C25 family cysteine peptidase [bacterium]|nr:C25 family cysteine peptidase [bacterium]